MLCAFESNRTEKLLDIFARELPSHRGVGFFDPAIVIVPNRNFGAYIKLGVARLQGIAGNFRVSNLDSFKKTIAVSNAPGDVLVVDERLLDDLLLTALLDDQVLQHAELGSVRQYLMAAGTRQEIVDTRRAQLFRQLSILFLGYVDTRPQLLAEWEDRLVIDDADFADTEMWQRRLWLTMFGPGGLLERRLSSDTNFNRWRLPTELLMSIKPSELKLPSQLHFFGFPYLPGSVPALLDHLAEACNVFVYILAPGAESRNHPKQWELPGREHIELLRSLPHCQVSSDGEATPAAARVEILGCPTVRRELEVIASEIWTALRENEALRFNEIAVLLPSSRMEDYQALIDSVFGDMHEIPVAATDLPAGRRSRVVEAAELLLALPLSRLTRRDVLRFATHPAVFAQFPETDPDVWTSACESTGIAYGADRRDHEDTYINGDILNWDQGLKRLALGAFMSGERSNDDRLFHNGSGTYLAEELEVDNVTAVSQFGLLVRSLLEDLKFVRSTRMTLPGWAHFLATLVSTYVSAESEEDEGQLNRCLEGISAIGRMTLDGEKVRYRIPYELVRPSLERIQASGRHPLLEGVVVAPLSSVAGLPFKIVFAAGLGEGNFPAPDRRNRIDLREVERLPGDVSSRERDKYHFLQTLLGTREKLYLSYVARDPLTGERLQPSSLIVELKEACADLGPLEIRERTFPLARYEDSTTCRSSTVARKEARARELGREVRHVAHSSGETPTLSTLKSSLNAETWSGLRELLSVSEAPDAAVSSQHQLTDVSLTALRRFLECPLQGSARFFLRMEEEDEDEGLWREEETFHAAPIDRARILRDVFWSCIAEPSDDVLARNLDEVLRREEMRGRFPIGVFGNADRTLLWEILTRWRESLRSIVTADASTFRTYSFGASHRHARGPIERPDPLMLNGLRLSGSTQTILDDPRGSVILSTKGAAAPKNIVKGFLDHVALSAAGLGAGGGFAMIALTNKPNATPEIYHFAPLEPEVAHTYLENLVSDLRSGVHHYLLPFETIMRLSPDEKGDVDRRQMSWTLRFLHENLRGTSSEYGPVRHPERALAPDDDHAIAIIKRRFGLLFESLQRNE